MKLFGRPRLASRGQRGISVFDIQARMGHSSPEVHHLFPRHLTVRQALESAMAETPVGRPALTHEIDVRIERFLWAFREELRGGRWRRRVKGVQKPGPHPVSLHEAEYNVAQRIADEVEWADELRFGELPTGAQKIVLFLRTLVGDPDLVILDEAFSGMDAAVRDRCLDFLEHGEETVPMPSMTYRGRPRIESPDFKQARPRGFFAGLTPRQALLVISHVSEEVPACVSRYVCLPDQGEARPPRMGLVSRPIRDAPKLWAQIWS